MGINLKPNLVAFECETHKNVKSETKTFWRVKNVRKYAILYRLCTNCFCSVLIHRQIYVSHFSSACAFRLENRPTSATKLRILCVTNRAHSIILFLFLFVNIKIALAHERPKQKLKNHAQTKECCLTAHDQNSVREYLGFCDDSVIYFSFYPRVCQSS